MPGPVLLNNVDHHDLRIALGHGEAFGDCVNQVIVFPTEFEELQREYAILFRRDEDGFRAIAPLGFERGENLFVEDGRWAARTIPALLARGPFSVGVPAAGAPGEPMIHVDLEHPRISRDAGAPLFLEHGGNAPYLEHVAAVLRLIHAGAQATGPLYAAWEALDLFDPVTLDIEGAGGGRFSVPDVHTLHPERFARLDGAALEALHRADHLRPAVWAMASLGNVARLAAMKERRDGGS